MEIKRTVEVVAAELRQVQSDYSAARSSAQVLNAKRRELASELASLGVSSYKGAELIGLNHVSMYRLMTGKQR